MRVAYQSMPTALVLPTNRELKFTIDSSKCNQRLTVENFKNTCSTVVISKNGKQRVLSQYGEDLRSENMKEAQEDSGIGKKVSALKVQLDYYSGQQKCIMENTQINSTHSMLSLDIGVSKKRCPYTLIFDKDVALLVPNTMYQLMSQVDSSAVKYSVSAILVFLFGSLSMCNL